MKLRIYSLILSLILAFGGLWLGAYLMYYFDSLALVCASLITTIAFVALGAILFGFTIFGSTKDWDDVRDLFKDSEVPK